MSDAATQPPGESKALQEPVKLKKTSLFEWNVDPDDIIKGLLIGEQILPIPKREKDKDE